MILVDANLLLYAIDRDSARHAAARAWLEELLSGSTLVLLPWTVLLAVLRLSTRSGIFQKPLSLDRAAGYIDSWLAQPFVELAEPGPRHWQILRDLLAEAGTGGNLTSDAHLAAPAIEKGASVASCDDDFRRFPGLRFFDPLV